MKITNIQTFLVDAGWRPWGIVRIETDAGIVGYGECTCLFTQYAVLGAIEDMKPILLGTDPRAYEMRFWDMFRRLRLGSIGGATSKAVGALECALIDIKAKALGVSVIELFGGPTRATVPVYFSHFLGYRVAAYQFLGKKPIESVEDVEDAAHEAKAAGFNALKCNLPLRAFPLRMDQSGFGGELGSTDQYVSEAKLDHLETVIRAIRGAVGDSFGIILDINHNCKPEGAIRVAERMRPYKLMWLELDMDDPRALLDVKRRIDMPVCSGETLFYPEGYLPYFQKRALDVVMIDTIWNGFSQSLRIGQLAQTYRINTCVHNYYSHLSTFISASLCGVLPNVRVLEVDGEDVPWKDELFTHAPELVNGEMRLPLDRPGWGTEPNLEVFQRYRWQRRVSSITIPSGFDAPVSEAPMPNVGGEQPLVRTTLDSLAGPWAPEHRLVQPFEVSRPEVEGGGSPPEQS
jgi:L-alanine-DL-glutamate epimerase-like enolase superfamily enzyme